MINRRIIKELKKNPTTKKATKNVTSNNSKETILFHTLKEDFMNEEMKNWLLEGDPSIVWQTKSFLGHTKNDVKQERSKMEQEGWCKRILEKQNADGSWGEGMYSPKYTSTTYSLLLLKRIGTPQENEQCKKGADLLFQGLQPDGGINFAKGPKVQGEACITGMIFSLINYFELEDKRIEKIFDYIKVHQMQDGGWNCKYMVRKATHASFNTTMLVLEGLQSYRQRLIHEKKDITEIEEMEKRGREFLLNHKLYKSHTTGEIVKEDHLRFPFPYQWKYDILTALDYFQESNASNDKRLEDAIELVKSKSKDGYLKNFRGQSGKIWFTMETVGKPSRYNTLRWQRVLKWWESVS